MHRAVTLTPIELDLTNHHLIEHISTTVRSRACPARVLSQSPAIADEMRQAERRTLQLDRLHKPSRFVNLLKVLYHPDALSCRVSGARIHWIADAGDILSQP